MSEEQKPTDEHKQEWLEIQKKLAEELAFLDKVHRATRHQVFTAPLGELGAFIRDSLREKIKDDKQE